MTEGVEIFLFVAGTVLGFWRLLGAVAASLAGCNRCARPLN